VAFALAALSGCVVRSNSPLAFQPSLPQIVTPGVKAKSPIKHVVLVIQENRTFNDFFAGFPGADGTKVGKIAKSASCHVSADTTIALRESDLATTHDLNHTYKGYATARNGGAMNGFDNVKFFNGLPECTYPYQYTDPKQIQPYWDLARQYALAEHMFTTQGSSSFTAHQDLIAGGTVVARDEALVNDPGCGGPQCIWGCDAPPGTRTSLISRGDVLQPGKGPFPCLSYATLRDRLDAAHVSWKYYVPKMCCRIFGKLMSAFDAIEAVRYGPQWSDGHIASPQTRIFEDLRHGALPGVSWIIPIERDSDHPGTRSDTGPSWVTAVVNAIGESPYWDSTAIVIVWDDWGGLYDNLNPRQVGFGGLGFRVPALIVSAYAKPGHVSTTHYEFGSILKYIERNWNLRSLGRSDVRAASIADCFDYAAPPREFHPIRSKYLPAYFLREPAASAPPDTDW
jgi:phospholipase C